MATSAQSPESPATRADLPHRLWRAWRVLVAVVLGYRGEQLALRAGNLTFITFTSLVPLAAVVLALIHALNEKRIDALVTRFFEDVLSPGGRSQAQELIRRMLDVSSSRTVGSVSFAVLLVSAGVLLRHLDASLNDLWAVRRPRPIIVSIGLYAGVLVFLPVLMTLALLGTQGAKALVVWLNLPYSATWFALGAVLISVSLFTGLYKLAPHAPVKWSSALFGGAVAGTVWELARALYGTLAGILFARSPLYGSVGVAPLFLFWVYLGWYVVLSGARLAYAIEHKDFHDEFADLLAHPRSQELIGTRIAAHLARANLDAAPAPTLRTLSAAMRMPAQRVDDVVHMLEKGGLVIRSKKGELVPASDPARLTLADISRAVGGTALTLQRERQAHTGRFESVAHYFTAVDEGSVEKLKGISWADLAADVGAMPQKP